MTIRITDIDVYAAPATPCARGPHSITTDGHCIAGPKCNGCMNNGKRIHLDQAQPLGTVLDPTS